MAMASVSSKTAAERRRMVMIGDLPQDFLRIDGADASSSSTSTDRSLLKSDEKAALALSMQLNGQGNQRPMQAGVPLNHGQPAAVGYYSSFIPANTRGRLSITIVQAKLAKNYGLLMRMDPYCRVRVGTTVFETPTNVSGGKNPNWNRTVHCYLPIGVETMYVEIFDERAFQTDERIAWAHITIPTAVFNMETIDDWYPLTGQLGEGKEGMINLIIAFSPVDAPIHYIPMAMNQPMMVPGQTPVLVPLGQQQVGVQPAVAAAAGAGGGVPAVLFTNDDVKELKEMFPNMDEEVIRSVMDEKRGNKDAAINALLSMGD